MKMRSVFTLSNRYAFYLYNFSFVSLKVVVVVFVLYPILLLHIWIGSFKFFLPFSVVVVVLNCYYD